MCTRHIEVGLRRVQNRLIGLVSALRVFGLSTSLSLHLFRLAAQHPVLCLLHRLHIPTRLARVLCLLSARRSISLHCLLSNRILALLAATLPVSHAHHKFFRASGTEVVSWLVARPRFIPAVCTG
ncbi:hypothetical protein FA95DRAFT_1192869 [Auriscalpium vulgare]|uniref:Uncharacterized protein n=1 Tax=Auriscalpium vulgare TaxID=40419 RepID=A0ACB8RVG5_9AGAM|nr:hypothetical protein FA95DRAFT_1192869 [Auriscalpium vulgare]